MNTSSTTSALCRILSKIDRTAKDCGRVAEEIKLLAVTKNQPTIKIESLLTEGQRLFGENRVQEAQSKWPLLKQTFPDIILHLIGHLQSNKVKQAVELFDVIETLDSLHLAKKLQQEEQRQKKQLEYYIEINIGREPQKSGVLPDEFGYFYKCLLKETSLKITGIMCIPPHTLDPILYFKEMQEIAKSHSLKNISMGMSEDYPVAIEQGSTLIRLGRALMRDD